MTFLGVTLNDVVGPDDPDVAKVARLLHIVDASIAALDPEDLEARLLWAVEHGEFGLRIEALETGDWAVSMAGRRLCIVAAELLVGDGLILAAPAMTVVPRSDFDGGGFADDAQ